MPLSDEHCCTGWVPSQLKSCIVKVSVSQKVAKNHLELVPKRKQKKLRPSSVFSLSFVYSESISIYRRNSRAFSRNFHSQTELEKHTRITDFSILFIIFRVLLPCSLYFFFSVTCYACFVTGYVIFQIYLQIRISS